MGKIPIALPRVGYVGKDHFLDHFWLRHLVPILAFLDDKLKPP